MLPDDLRPDCTACLALCCVAPGFDALQGFGYDKPPATPCRHLQPDCRCGIHARLLESGFPGCVRFDCYGAGQRAVREFAVGADRRDLQGAEALLSAYEHLRGLHELKAMVHFTMGRVTGEAQRGELHQRLEDIEALCRTAQPRAARQSAVALRADTLKRLRALLPTHAPSP